MVFSRGDHRRAKGKDVRGLGNRVGQETHGDAFAEPAHSKFIFHGGVANEPRIGHQIQEIASQLEQFGNAGLHEDMDFRWVNARGEIIQSDLNDVVPDFLDVPRVVGEGLGVGDHDEHLVEFAFVLKFDAAP